jgi:hypothetical protein
MEELQGHAKFPIFPLPTAAYRSTGANIAATVLNMYDFSNAVPPIL